MADQRPQIVGVSLAGRAGCVASVLLLMFLALPLAELALLFWSARHVGFWWTLLLCVGTAIAGSAIARWQGAAVFRRAQEAFARGEMPTEEVFEGAMLLIGGVMLLAPGFITDALGLLLLLPPVRGLVKSIVRRRRKKRSGVIDVKPEP